MFTKTRAMCVLAGSALLAALAGAIGSPAEAAPGSALGIPWATQSVGGESVLPQQFQAGDCHLRGLRETGNLTQARVELMPANSGYWIQWDYSMYSDSIWVEWPFSGP